MPLTLYLDPCTINSRKVLSGLDHLGTQYDLKHIDYFKGEQKSEAFLKINPFATVPAAVDGDLVLTESNAILQYAADISGAAGEKAYPKDLKQRANINRWLLWEASGWFPSNYIYVVENVVKPLLSSQPDQSVLDGEAPRFNKFAAILDEQLGKTKYLTSDEPSIADFAVAAPMHVHAGAKLPLDPYPNLKRWIGDIEKLPAWASRQAHVEKSLGLSKYVTASLNFTKDLGAEKLTELYFYEDDSTPPLNTIHEPGDDPKDIPIHDAWPHVHNFSLDINGFSLQNFEPSLPQPDQWSDNAYVQSSFYPQVVSFLQSALSAPRVLVFDHTIRTRGNQGKKLTDEKNTSQRAPVQLVHADYTFESAPIRVKQLLPESEHADVLSRRFVFINVWVPLSDVEESPLAMCDARSVPTEDVFKLYLRYRDRTGENYVMKHSDQQTWWYFPNMKGAKQCILLKTYDSDEARARFVGHSAFADPTSPPDAKIRESVEIRTICFF